MCVCVCVYVCVINASRLCVELCQSSEESRFPNGKNRSYRSRPCPRRRHQYIDTGGIIYITYRVRIPIHVYSVRRFAALVLNTPGKA